MCLIFVIKGYSWKSNQYGLTIDTVTAFELVKPNGQVINVTEASDPNLFFGLKVCRIWRSLFFCDAHQIRLFREGEITSSV